VIALLALTLVIASCGDDEPRSGGERGEPVEGRVPSTSSTSSTSTTTTTTTTSTTRSGPAGNGSTPTTTTTTTTAPTTAAPTTSAAPPTTVPPTTEARGARPLGEVAIQLTEVARAEAPTKLVARPGSDRLYVAEQGGRVVAFEPDGDGLREAGTALDLSDVTTSGGERGLLGLAFSPGGDVLYVHHSGPDGETRIARFTMDGDAADAGSRVDLLTVDQPYPNHNGGDIVTGPDGHLWIGLGDGGSGGDPEDRAQNADELLGKVLRIDPTGSDGDRPYRIPADNPFASGGGRPEIAVTGVRNPWRLRFDAANGDLWIADVGQDGLEEIDRLAVGAILGANLGWSRFEGSEVYDDSREVRGGDAVGPVFEMSHSDGWCSVTGGLVYRGSRIPSLDGGYLFGDFCKPGLGALRHGGTQVSDTAVLDEDVDQVVSIDADLDGEVYVLSLSGVIARLEPA